MPRFSIIVPSHGVAGRLSQALDSVLAQSFGDLELIPVCDGPDAPAASVAAGYAERDCRVVPVHSPPSAGLSGARNTGVRAASGTYLLFLDGDDVLVPGALALLDARLTATGDVDVLYFEHERTPWWEGEPTNPAAPLLASAPPGPCTPEQAPGLTGVALPAWSAAYRRAFVADRRLVFPAGHFTDVGWGGLTTVAAGRVAALRAVVVRHRLRRQGSRLNLPGPHQRDLLDQVELVLQRAAGLPDDRARVLFEQVFELVLRTAARPERRASRPPARVRRARRRRRA
ncbi:glycosyltransferase family A protein, partial [Streptomyces sp. NPDC127079]|uniref:glycosyltransferase family A protein n=1 Tax=Streptomyces sp. NPDC127079 TaxID=3347132 RepID=UPI003646F1D7